MINHQTPAPTRPRSAEGLTAYRPGANIEHALSLLGGEKGKNLGALVDDVRRGVDALDPAGSIVIELEHRHTGLLRRAAHLDGNDDGNPRRRPGPVGTLTYAWPALCGYLGIRPSIP